MVLLHQHVDMPYLCLLKRARDGERVIEISKTISDNRILIFWNDARDHSKKSNFWICRNLTSGRRSRWPTVMRSAKAGWKAWLRRWRVNKFRMRVSRRNPGSALTASAWNRTRTKCAKTGLRFNSREEIPSRLLLRHAWVRGIVDSCFVSNYATE